MNKSKTTYSIRGKLISAAAMLLVAVIMVVSSTYAWFTLSTAPEVTGISTAIGANGALEMALNTGDEIKTGEVGQSALATKTNLYWGNLVDLSDASYGSADVVLLPSKLVLAEDGKVNIGSSILSIPVYGSDGRVTHVDGEKTVTGTYVDGSFVENEETGFRAVGVASGMTDRQLTYRSAMANAKTKMSSAKTAAATSLEKNGAALANIAIKHGTWNGAAADERYSEKEIADLQAIVDALLADNGPVVSVEDAYLQYILAYAASSESGLTDEQVIAFKAIVNAEGATLTSVTNELSTTYSITLPETFTTLTDKIAATRATLEEADDLLAVVPTDGSATWADITEALHLLANTEDMLINDKTIAEVKANQEAFVGDVAANGLLIEIATGGGVYADIADHCGDYRASVLIDIHYNSITLENFSANMATRSSVTPPYLQTLGAAIPAAPTGDSTEAKPMTEFYGFIVDLAFRTNAAQSDLLLQTTPTDRIYKDNAENDLTWGGGSTMSFSSTSNSFTTDQMKRLMDSICIVFFNTADGTVLGNAILDTANAVNNGTGLTASMYLTEEVTTYTYADDAGTTVTVYSKDGTTFYTDKACTTAATIPEGTVPTAGASETVMITDTAKAAITPLTQNTQVNVSALVYLNGETLTNADVAADVAQSMAGTMNLQFSSSANLVPMEYADYHTPTTTAGDAAAEANP